jgi:hypothetical protein
MIMISPNTEESSAGPASGTWPVYPADSSPAVRYARDPTIHHHRTKLPLLPEKRRMKKISAGGCRLYKETPPGRKPEDDLAAGLPPVKISLGEEDPDPGPDTALAVAGIEFLDNLADVAALFICDSLEDVKMDRCWHKNFRSFKGNCFHGCFFHITSW